MRRPRLGAREDAAAAARGEGAPPLGARPRTGRAPRGARPPPRPSRRPPSHPSASAGGLILLRRTSSRSLSGGGRSSGRGWIRRAELGGGGRRAELGWRRPELEQTQPPAVGVGERRGREWKGRRGEETRKGAEPQKLGKLLRCCFSLLV